MKKTIAILALLLSFGAVYAQKIKMKKGKVYVDKKEYLTYKSTDKGDVFSSLEGKVLFILKKGSIEKENEAKKNTRETNEIESEIEDKINRTSANDGLRRGDHLTKKKKKKINYVDVRFFSFNLQYETTLKKSKILREFYKSEILNIAGVIDQVKARRVAAKMSKDVTGKYQK